MKSESQTFLAEYKSFTTYFSNSIKDLVSYVSVNKKKTS
ncbi:hypothetical protein Mpsy_0164 [Methanolobus psychrophilus R15]|nr:hypothetical protein Mpsy_0164 [Methanolobus psychrophilus R15]